MNERLLEYLLQHQMLSAEQVQALREAYRESKKSVRELILEQDLLAEDKLIAAFAEISHMPVVKLYENPIPSEVSRLVRPDLLRANTVIPFAFDANDPGLLLVAVNDPMNMRGRDVVAISAKCRVRPYLATTTDILLAIDRYYGSDELREAAKLYTQSTEQETSVEAQAMQDDVNSSPVVILVTSMVEQAVRQRASDIHVEAGPNTIRVRYRVDGVLYTTATYDVRLLSAVIARIKIISGLDISEKRKPQDGRFSITVDNREYDVRVSILPTVYGEKCVMRLAQKKVLAYDKRTLGFTEEDVKKFDRILRRPNGLLLVTGPTGSGKSRTLYTALSELNSDAVNIVTVEDPVEANIDGINQVQVNVKAGLTFATTLRSILRQDPDIIMIGEIRDQETAAIAVQASITGHLVLSTLHTNDTASTVARLMDMDVKSYLIADATVGIIAKRLVRQLCPACKRKRHLHEYEAQYLDMTPDQCRDIEIYEPVGCQSCGGTGYYDRIGVYEIMEISPTLQKLIAARCTTDELREAAIKEGMTTLKESARKLVLAGSTSLAEMNKLGMEDVDWQAVPNLAANKGLTL